MSEFRGVTPPNSVEAEQSVLGAMMQDENAVLQAAEALSTDDFYQPAHREIFEAMVALHHQQRPIDLVTVDAELTRRGTLEGIGGTEYLMRLMSFVPTTANVKAYITLVAEKSTLRKLIKASQEISQECYSQQNPLQETLGHAEKAIFDIVMNRASGESLVHVRDVLYNTYANIEELAKLKGRVSADRLHPAGQHAHRSARRRTHHHRRAPVHGQNVLRDEHRHPRRTLREQKRRRILAGNAARADCPAYALLRRARQHAKRPPRHPA